MSCNQTNTTKPDVVERPNNFYGAPQGQAGREFNEVDYGVQGIILHCTDMTISQYIQYLACLTQPVQGVNQETNHHYSIGSAGALNQHIADENISWTFGNYNSAAYPTPPGPTISVDWPALQAQNGANVSPDVYVINILIAKSYNQTTTCLTSSGLPADQHDKLIQLLAYLSATYDIPLDADHINWHDNIATQACPANECNCNDIACLITDINTFCEEDCNQITYGEVDCDSVSHLLAIPNNCGNSAGCLVSVPFDACCFGHLPQEGDIDIFVGLTSTNDDPCAPDAEYCLVKNFINVSAPITGKGTADDPLALDLCLFGDFVPEGEPVALLGVDTSGCLVGTDADTLIASLETQITVVDTNTVDLTASGTSNHTLQADIKISGDAGNLIEARTDGLFVELACDSFKDLFEQDTLTYLYGVDAQGECAFEDAKTLVDRIICAEPVSVGTFPPLHILGRNTNLDCPEYFTPTQVVMAGLTVTDTNSVDVDLTDGVLTANVIVDPDASNRFSIQSSGVYVPPLTATELDGCINATIVDNELNIGLNIDPATDNILSCRVDGLYVKDLVPTDTDCINFDYNETTRILEASIIFASTLNNIPNAAICSTGNGFYVPQAANLLVNGPLIGGGYDGNPLDIDFSLMDNQDLCDFGGVIPETLSLVDVIGLDANSCLRQYTGEQFIQQFLLVEDTDCINITLDNNILTVDIVVSPARGGFNNILTCTDTGLYVPIGAGITPVATNCIDMQLVNGILTATSILNPDPLNQISCTVDGFYVERGAGAIGGTTDCVQILVTNGEITATPIISGTILGIDNVLTCEAGGLFVPIGAGINPVTTDCIDVTFDTATGNLVITPIISPLTDNIIECTVNGLYVPGGFIEAVSDTDCITLDVSGGALTATPIIDPSTQNLLECGPDGLFAIFATLDTNCMTLTLADGVLSVEPIIDPDTTNLLECGANGLFAQLDPSVFVDSNCIDFDVAGGLVTAELIFAPDQAGITNVAVCLDDGLYVPVAAGLTVVDIDPCLDLNLDPAGVLTGRVIVDPDLNNQLICGPNGLIVQPLTFVPTNCIDITFVGNVVTINPILSATADNQIQCLADGFYVPNCCPQVVDTNTVDLTLIGTNTIQADVTVDPLADNVLVANPAGLYVPPGAGITVVDTDCLDLDLTNGVFTATVIVDPAADNLLTCIAGQGLYVPPITVVDTNCIDLNLVNNVLTANPILSATADNALECLGDGLYVPQGANAVGIDTNCISVSVVDGVVSATPIISALTNNQLSCEVDGLYVSEEFITAITNSDCIDLSVNNGVLEAEISISSVADNNIVCLGDGLYVPTITVLDTACIDLNIVNDVLTANPILSANADNILQCVGDGLYVPELNVLDTNCIDLDITNNTLTVNPILSATADNILQCLGDGLYVPEPIEIVGDNTDCISVTVNNGVITATPIIDPALDNQLQCLVTGLYVPEPFITSVVDTDCLDLEVVGGVLTATVIIDPAVDNQLVCGAGTGLYVAPITVVDTNCIDLDLTNNVLTANPIISIQAENAMQCLGDGLFVQECCPLVTDTQSVDLTLTGTRTISADVVIDPDINNQLVLNPDGLYVPEPYITAIADHQCLDLDVTNGILTVTPVIDPATNNILTCGPAGLYAEAPIITVADTDCIALVLNAGELTAIPVIDPVPDNALSCLATGLYVPEAFITAINSTQCIDVDVTGGVLTVTPIISPLADNLLVCQGDGLYVPPLTAVDTGCIDLDITGGVLTAAVIVDPAADNTLVCQGTGLYVPALTVVDGNCIDLEITGTVLTAEIIISGQAENAINCLVDGLFVQECCPLVADTLTVDMTLTGLRTISADVIIDPDATNSLVVNPDGLFVPEAFIRAVADTPCITATVTDGLLTIDPIINPNPGNAIQCLAEGLFAQEITVDDTDCFDLTIVDGVITGEVILAPVQNLINNAIQCIPGQGLYVPEGAGINVLDTTNVNMDLIGNVLSSTVILDPMADNLIEDNGQGLYVPPLAVIADQCVNLDVVGNVISGNLIIDPIVNNLLTCGVNGLAALLTVIDTPCIDLDITDGVLTANPIIAPAQDVGGGLILENGLQCLADGLYVPLCDWTVVSANTCEDGGVGAGYYVEEFDIDQQTCTVTINSIRVKPDIGGGTSATVQVDQEQAINTWETHYNREISITADPCYDITILLTLSATIQADIPAGSDPIWSLFYTRNGVDVTASQGIFRPGIQGVDRFISGDISTAVTLLIPAGSGANIFGSSLRSRYNAGTPSAPVFSLDKFYFTGGD